MSVFSIKDELIYNFTSLLILLFSTILILNLSVNPQIQEDKDEITIDSSLVILNAKIIDKNSKTAPNLSKDQFLVFENGVKQEIAFFSKQETPFAVVILIDTSGSMQKRVSLARAATIKFLDNLRADDFVAIYNFDSKVSLVQDFSNLKDLIPQVYDLRANGWTVLNDAIYEAVEKLETRTEKRKAIVVLSDGADTRSGRSAKKALNSALKSNITIYTVDMSEIQTGGKKRFQNRAILKNFADQTGGEFIKTPGGFEMRDAFESIVKDLGTQYTIGYYPQNIDKDGKWRKITLKTAIEGLTIRTRKGYFAPKN